jgi:hypothetical protein
MKSLLLWVPILATATALSGERPSVGLVSKVVYDVTRKELDSDWQKALRGETLASGDRVKTGDRSLAVIKFKDNSLVRVRERSELTVAGGMNGRAFSKEVRIDKGVVGFTIQKQQPEEEFRFTSPTSVASIRGTGGSFSRQLVDTLVVTEGSILFTNTISSQSVFVEAGFTGISSPDGAIVTRPSTPGERQSALDASRVGEQENKLEFELRDRQGGRKQLRIDYR